MLQKLNILASSGRIIPRDKTPQVSLNFTFSTTVSLSALVDEEESSLTLQVRWEWLMIPQHLPNAAVSRTLDCCFVNSYLSVIMISHTSILVWLSNNGKILTGWRL